MSIPRTDVAKRGVELIPKTPQETVKALLVIAVTLFAALRASLSDDVFSPVEGVQLIIQAATLIPVFLLTGVVLKTIAAFVLAGLQFLVPAITSLAGWQAWDSLTFDDYAGAILAAMLAIGIAVVPNAPAPAPVDVVVVNEPSVVALSAYEKKVAARDQPAAGLGAKRNGTAGSSAPTVGPAGDSPSYG